VADPKTPTPDAASTPAPAAIELGKKYRLKAAFGLTINPFTLDRFDTDLSKRVEVDRWTLIQFEAGKLVIENDD
jgi:hypothetical protein